MVSNCCFWTVVSNGGVCVLDYDFFLQYDVLANPFSKFLQPVLNWAGPIIKPKGHPIGI
jgi:hypothetical protein